MQSMRRLQPLFFANHPQPRHGGLRGAVHAGDSVMRVVMAADPAGQEYLEQLRAVIEEHGWEVCDLSAEGLPSDDWPTVVLSVGSLVVSGQADRGIVIGPTGNGEALVINRMPEIRCTVCWDSRSARVARQELDANVLALSRELVPAARARRIVATWLQRSFRPSTHHEPERFERRLPDLIVLGNSNGRGRHLSPFLDEPTYICEHCREEFAFQLELLDGATQELIEECPICGQENRILVEIDAQGAIRTSGDPDVSH
jgi:ribose 5-phosphate isomerase B